MKRIFSAQGTRSAALLLAGSFLSSTAFAQRSGPDTITRSVGLGAYIQMSQPDFLIPLWVAPNLVVVPEIRFSNTENSKTDLGVGLALRIYSKIARIAPYFGVRGRADLTLPSGGGGSSTDITAGAFAGGEYFINNQFSFGIEAHLLAMIPDTGSRKIETETKMLANIYF